MSEENLPFQKKFNEAVDSFGYEWEIRGKKIILDMQRKNQASLQYEQLMNKPLRHILMLNGINEGSSRGKRLVKAYLKPFSWAKLPSLQDIGIGTPWIVLFSYIFYGFAFITYTPLGMAIDFAAIVMLLRSVYFSLKSISKTDDEYLGSNYQFQKKDHFLILDALQFAKMLENIRIRILLFSLIFILISVFTFVYKFPQLIFASDVLNFMVFFSAVIALWIQVKSGPNDMDKDQGSTMIS